MAVASNRGVAYMGPGKVEVQGIDFPKLELESRKCDHGVILKVVATNICGSDQHMVRGRTTAPEGLILGHEITGEVIEAGRDVEFVEVGDIVSAPFNIACGRCRNCKEGKTGICLNVNPARPGAAYGYVDMGGWVGGQAEYVMVPYADFNLLKFPDRDVAMSKMDDLTLLSDIFPTGFHGAVSAGVGPGSIVYVAGAGPVGLACAASCQLLGAACVIVGDMIPERLAQARSFGCETVDLREDASLSDQIEAITGDPEVDCAVDCVGFEARGHGSDAGAEHPATVLNAVMEVTRAGGAIGRRRQRQGWAAWHPHRTRLGEVALLHDGAMPGHEVQPQPDERHPLRQDQDRRGGQRDGHLPRRRPRRVRRLRPGRREEVRHRPARGSVGVAGPRCECRESAASALGRSSRGSHMPPGASRAPRPSKGYCVHGAGRGVPRRANPLRPPRNV